MRYLRTSALIALVMLGGCVSTHPVPFAVERSGTIPAEEYPALERQAEAAEPVVKAQDGTTSPSPEPRWVYAFKPGFDPHGAVLAIGAFTGVPCKPAEVARELPGRLKESLSGLKLFSRVTTETEPGAYVLSGTVTRTPDVETTMTQAGTQVEATVTRDGTIAGVIQVNAVQMQPGMAFAGSPIATLGTMLVSTVVSASQGSRASYVSDKFADIFERTGHGQLQGIDTGSMSRAYIYPQGSRPTLVTQRDNGLNTSTAACAN